VVVRTLVAGTVVNETARSLAGGLNEVDWTVDVDRPRLWWPWSLGEQHLTDVEVQVLIDGEQSDNRHVRTGLREVAMADFVLTVNGEPIFVKGVNLLPTRAALADATANEVRRDIALARDAGLDLVRVNGHIARPELYDAADELGMLVWQDFPLQWNYARTVRRQAVRQAREAVDMLGHHPSIAVWCAHNDPAPVAERRLNTPSIVRNLLQQQVPSWNRTILDQWVKRAFESADETRPTVAHSGVSDSHLYFGWYHGDERDLAGFAATMPRQVRFVGEFGTQSVPNTDDFIEPTKWPSLDWEHLTGHHGLDLEVFNQRFPVAGYTSYTAWRDATQRYQADVLRHHIETLRRLKYRPTGGFCFLTLADPSPAISWSVLDHERHPKAAWSAVVEACRPVIVVADRLPAEVAPGTALALDIHVVSDLRHPLDAVRCTAQMRWPGGGHQWQWQGDIGADTCVRVGTCQMVVPEAPGELWLDLTLEHDHLVASNRYTCRITA
jgi:beta-mannosidase